MFFFINLSIKVYSCYIFLFILDSIYMPPKKSKKIQGFKIGKVTLKPEASQNIIQLLTNLSKKINLNGFRWELIKNLYKNNKVGQIFPYVADIAINHLNLTDNNYGDQLIKQVCLINDFVKLQTLELNGNQITSLEGLNNLNAPKLWRLLVRNNHLCTIKTMRRWNFPNLTMIYLADNNLASIEGIQELNANLSWVQLQNNSLLTSSIPLIKTNTTQLQHIYLYETKCIKKQLQKMMKMFTKKLNEEHQQMDMQF